MRLDSSLASKWIGCAAAVRGGTVNEGVHYLHSPNYLRGSRLAPMMDRLPGVPAAARNWRACGALQDMIKRRT